MYNVKPISYNLYKLRSYWTSGVTWNFIDTQFLKRDLCVKTNLNDGTPSPKESAVIPGSCEYALIVWAWFVICKHPVTISWFLWSSACCAARILYKMLHDRLAADPLSLMWPRVLGVNTQCQNVWILWDCSFIWGEPEFVCVLDPVPVFMSWQEESESGEAQLSPLAGRMLQLPLGEDAQPLLARHYLDFGHTQRFLQQDSDAASSNKALSCGRWRDPRTNPLYFDEFKV